MTEQELQEHNDHIMYMQSIEEECAIDINKKIEHPPVAISFKNKEVVTKDGSVKEFPIPIGTYGNFSFIQAPPKNTLYTLIQSKGIGIHKECLRG